MVSVVYKGAFFATSFLLQLVEAKTRDFLMLPALAGRFFFAKEHFQPINKKPSMCVLLGTSGTIKVNWVSSS